MVEERRGAMVEERRGAFDFDKERRATAERVARGLYWDKALTLVSGCVKVSAGCAHCWAERETARFPARAEYAGVLRDGVWTGEVVCNRKALQKPLSVSKAAIWSVWNDLFHYHVPDDFIADFLSMARACQWHTFLVLTKRAARLAEVWGGESLPSNVWVGVTAEDQRNAEARVPKLLRVPAAVRFVSAEPLLGPLVLDEWLDELQWVVVGAESGAGRRSTDEEWARAVVGSCLRGCVPTFLKQLERDGKLVKLPALDGEIYDQFPAAPPYCGCSRKIVSSANIRAIGGNISHPLVKDAGLSLALPARSPVSETMGLLTKAPSKDKLFDLVVGQCLTLNFYRQKEFSAKPENSVVKVHKLLLYHGRVPSYLPELYCMLRLSARKDLAFYDSKNETGGEQAQRR